MSSHSFNPVQALEILTRHRVRFVVIGGIAGRLWGSTTVTNDLDICYARDKKNLEALARALQELGARRRDAPENLALPVDARALGLGDTFIFSTIAGNLDCIATPSGSQGFRDLVAGATKMQIETVSVLVVSLEDLIRLKKAAGRKKDLIELEVLAALKDEIEKSSPM